MTISKEVKIDKVEIVGDHRIMQVRLAIVLKEGSIELARNYHRQVITPLDDPHSDIQLPDGQVINIGAELQPYCTLLYTDEAKQAYQEMLDSQEV